ncbi:hypothetical protein N8D56_21460 [Devosia sp. A8/3-2]|nr:hypothetical protein N8D56_21460 [Devosia sp. A8/3-2]
MTPRSMDKTASRVSDERLADLMSAATPLVFTVPEIRRILTELQSLRSLSLDSGTGGQQPVAWQHCLVNSDGYEYDGEVNTSEKHPFGRPGRDYDASFSVISRPLYSSPTEPKAGVVEKASIHELEQSVSALEEERQNLIATKREQISQLVARAESAEADLARLQALIDDHGSARLIRLARAALPNTTGEAE